MYIDEALPHEELVDEQINEFIEAELSRENIIKIFFSYIIKNKITGIDKINNESFKKNMAWHAEHILKTIKNYHYSPYIEKLILRKK